MKNTNAKKHILIALVAFLTLPMVALNCQPAQAITNDPGVIDQLQKRRAALQTREFYLMRDTDDLLRKKEDIRRNNNADAPWQLNEVCRKIDAKAWELQQVRLDIRDVTFRLL